MSTENSAPSSAAHRDDAEDAVDGPGIGVEDVIETFDDDGVTSPTHVADAPAPG